MQQHPDDQRLARTGPELSGDDNLSHPLNRAFRWGLSVRSRLTARWPNAKDDRGDVSGWVLVTLMTAGLVVTLWAVAGPRLEEVFNDAMDRVVGGP